MARTRPIHWLHLSDLHMGCRGQEIWWQVHEELEASVREMVRRLGPPDLLLLTGDLTHTGAPAQFEHVDRFLDDLLRWLREAGDGSAPLLVAVPGNHDLERPQGRRALEYRLFDRWHEGRENPDVRLIEDDLWERRDPSFIDPLFTGYRAWFERRVRPALAARAEVSAFSHFPCDFSAVVRPEGAFPLLLVGLNSTWLQYDGGHFEGRLVMPARQFQAALGSDGNGSPLAALRNTGRGLLLQHHPPVWLSSSARKEFLESIYRAGRFDLCLHGHLHAGRSEEIQVSGGPRRVYYQSPSLFGLEHYGTAREERAMGCTWGSLAENGTVRVWPLRRVRRGGGECVFDRDQEFPEAAEGVVIGGPIGAAVGVAVPAAKVDFRPYLRDLVKRTDFIAISGIVTAAKGALRPPIEHLYTPLTTRSLGSLEAESGWRGLGAEKVGLAELLPRYRRLLLEGQPGAGKTTFLKLVACMLARDRLGEPCPGGGPWRRRFLGLEATSPVPLPILLRVGDLGDLLTAKDAPPLRHDQRLWLLDLLARSCEQNEHPIPREEWQRLLEEGQALLLLDGLDEVDDENLRQRVFNIFRDAAEEWPCPIVVTSRPLSTEPLRAMGFEVATVEPFGDGEIRSFLDQWLAALHGSTGPALGSEARRQRESLAEAILARPAVRRLATNPVMLTCLCVVHWSEGQIPQGRALVYKAVIRWLLQARSELRSKKGLTDLFAREAFARLAFHMMSTPKGKVSTLDLGEAAKAVAPLLARDPALATERARLDRAREWLLFEGTGSGIVEELSGRRVRFWHLTFQEYLAAVYLDGLGDGEHGEGQWWPLVRAKLDDAQWRETIDLLPGTLLERGSAGVDLLLERVLATRGSWPSLAKDAKAAGILGRLLAPLRVLDYRPPPTLQVAYDEALERSLAIFTREGAAQVSFEDRRAAAEALGQGGDPRLAPGVDTVLEVPGLEGLRLGRYPVTVEEFRLFVEALGYEELRFWSPEGWGERAERGWAEPDDWSLQLQFPNRPVVGVSWHEARAYCRWLSEQWGLTVRLPSAEEWERAATRARGEYPWGEDAPSKDRANFGNKVGAPTPVGLYPAGEGPAGHSDLAGDVWEWCEDEIELPEIQGYTKKGDLGRVLKGGGWFSSAGAAAGATRPGTCARPSAAGAVPGAAAGTSAFASPSRPRAVDSLIFVLLLLGSRGEAPGRS